MTIVIDLTAIQVQRIDEIEFAKRKFYTFDAIYSCVIVSILLIAHCKLETKYQKDVMISLFCICTRLIRISKNKIDLIQTITF